MAKGDSVIVHGVVPTTTQFQPASGVEILITFVSTTGSTDDIKYYAGGAAKGFIQSTSQQSKRMAVPLTNTDYVELASNSMISFSGIQVK